MKSAEVSPEGRGGGKMLHGHLKHAALERVPHHFYTGRQTHDDETHRDCMTGWRCVYEHIGRQSFRGEVTELWLYPFQIIRERLDQPCLVRGVAWPGALVFMSVTEAQGNFSVGGRAVRPNELTILPRDFEFEGLNSAPVESLAIAVKEAALVEFARFECGANISAESLRHSIAITDSEAVNEYRRSVICILEELQARPLLLDEERFRAELRVQVLRMLVGMMVAHIPSAQRLSPPTTRSYVVEKAAQYMEVHLADPMEMFHLCRAVRVCSRTLRYSFEEVVGVSPTQYLMALRLGRVRRALLQDGASTNVQCVAARFGFTHMGRFARFYFDAFGERPSDTLRRSALERAGGGQASSPRREYHRAEPARVTA
jgi:AraC family ethanolamine operon transcriptional activator